MHQSLTWARRETAAPGPQPAAFDGEFDVIVVGAGGGGLPAALFARWLGNSVVIVEKADVVGGTARKAAFWYWVPNNRPMREAGLIDDKDDCLRYMARLARPERYQPDAPLLGLELWEYEAFEAIYESAAPAAQALHERGALRYRHCADVTDYWAEMPENKAPRGRVLLPADACESMSDGGKVAVESMQAAALRDGVQIMTGVRVQRVIRNGIGEVAGVQATRASGEQVTLRARKAVIFATGGFTHDPALRANFLHAPFIGGCAARSNEGDFVRIASAAGAQLRNMNYAWMCPVALERVAAGGDDFTGTFSVGGDSMLWVNKTGQRVVNEKLAYNEIAQTFFEWDPQRAEYPNFVQIAIWDQRSQQHCASTEYGRLIRPSAGNEAFELRGETLDELTDAIRERLHKYAHLTGNAQLGDDFATNLRASIARFNTFAREGKDHDFRRGERLVERMFNGPTGEPLAHGNPTLYPLADTGPYYAALVAGGTLDTKGGPLTNASAQVLNDLGEPIPGLYGVGNCVASASARAYWAGGGTLGPIIAFAWRAAHAAHNEAIKQTAPAEAALG
ncbi:FAD-dependent oxidoreductase [Paraburkholderia sacchari]|uniref:FAD-dependent oxidoreductase n=1 Tax=Paraburkholderia sacchari TaxID=159450 RepID=UPI001BCFCD81|nr:FAD-dependent oxidoreductase [Paraburkholderia sacchari]